MLVMLDLALRVASLALLILLAALLGRDARGSLAGRLGVALAAGTAAYALAAAAIAADWPLALRAPLLALASGNGVVLWLFARALFTEDLRPQAWHGAAWLALAATSLVNCAVLVPDGAAPWLTPLLGAVALGFDALALGAVLTGWRGDLVDARRRLRTVVLGSAALAACTIGVLHLVTGATPPPVAASLITATLLLAVVTGFGLVLTRLGDDGLFTPAATAVPAPGVELTPSEDGRLAAALQRLMQEERVYRQEGLTIGALAARLQVPEYRLRRLINQRLGHRNFNAYLNGFRIAEAQAALADPAQARVPVTTIALDAGFQSLGPFNRAFKAVTGRTPSDYRRAAAAGGEPGLSA
jgi:AraC-like DNA-binding protein